MKETKSERFRRVAEARVNKIIRMLRLLGNCAATSVYAYLEGEYIENHYKIMIVRQSLCVSPRFLRETQAVQQSAVKDGVQ